MQKNPKTPMAMLRMVAGTCLAAGLLIVSGSTAAAESVRSSHPDYPLEAQLISENVWAIVSPARGVPDPQNRGWTSNAAFVITDDGVLVFDTGSSEGIGSAIAEIIGQITEQPVRWIINSHSHGDHWMGNAPLANPETEVIATPASRDEIRDEHGRWINMFNQMTAGATGEPRVVVPNRTIDQRTLESFGGLEVELIPLGPAHSLDDLVAWIPSQRILLAGDVVYVGTVPGTFAADILSWLDVHEVLLALDPELVVPGHGEVGTREDIEIQRVFFETLWNLTEEGYEEGLMDYEITPRIRAALQEQGIDQRYGNLDERIGETVSRTYLQVEEAMF
jgi:cyclase